MSFQDSYLRDTSGLDVHLRDARHAHQLYTEHGFALAPKTKYLYHVVFDMSDEVGHQYRSNTARFQKEIGVLVNQADLPQYRVSVENKQQYNRKKNIQTRLDYQDVNIRFHDDNLGLTRGLLEDYYKYYYVDGNHRDQQSSSGFFSASNAFKARDKYDETVPNYGLNNGKTNPFFRYIRIYQLAKRQWFAYTLINPLITAFDHGSVESSDASSWNANSITVSYESVIYSNGTVNEQGEPLAFTDPETRYDNVMSPLGSWSNSMSKTVDILSRIPTLIDPNRQRRNNVLPRVRNQRSRRDSLFSNSSNGTGSIGLGLLDLFAGGSTGGLLGAVVPNVDGRRQESPSTLDSGNRRILDGDNILREFNNRPSAKSSYIARALNINALPGETLSSYNSSNTASQSAIEGILINRAISGDKKLAEIATDAIELSKGSILT
jgi:hypothetical protein